MPVKKGKSQKVFKQNVKEIVRSYEKTGKIGTSKPKSKAKAIEQAVAIAYDQKRKGKK